MYTLRVMTAITSA